MKLKSGLWKFSPSSLYSFTECKTCFWAENHIGRHPFTLPLRLNSAMDEKLKSRYDKFRKNNEIPPELINLKEYKLFNDIEVLEDWRTKTSSLAYTNDKDGYIISGKLDEVLVNKKGDLVVADYKSSGDPPKDDKYKYYELQLNAYAKMIMEKGYNVADEAYLLHYFPKCKTNASMSVKLDFHADKVNISIPDFLEIMKEMVELLEGEAPDINNECKRCKWLEKRGSI